MIHKLITSPIDLIVKVGQHVKMGIQSLLQPKVNSSGAEEWIRLTASSWAVLHQNSFVFISLQALIQMESVAFFMSSSAS
ncbi:MAG: hypothetical protein WAM07_06925 [Halobacillus sp.]|uniref:hypothetical protein n=1 Tax=Halobacillus sp. TaxID=56800 RepID=UPI003BAF8089